MREADQLLLARGDKPMHRLQGIEQARPRRACDLGRLRRLVEIEIGAPKRRPLFAIAALDGAHGEVRQAPASRFFRGRNPYGGKNAALTSLAAARAFRWPTFATPRSLSPYVPPDARSRQPRRAHGLRRNWPCGRGGA